MAQKLRDDKIGTLQHNAGAIQMLASPSSPAYLTIGGQQYKVTSNLSRLIASDVSATANTRYQVFAVVVSGVVELRVSSNQNSVGPSGFTRWKLIGSFLSNYLNAFGAFINITGVPRCTLFNNGPISVAAIGGGSSKGAVVNDYYQISMEGEVVYLEYRYLQTTAGASGSLSYLIDLPNNIPFDLSKTAGAFVGTLTPADGTTRIAPTYALQGGFGTNVSTTSMTQSNGMAPVPYSTTQFRIAGGWTDAANTSVWHGSMHGFGNANLGMSGWMRYRTTSPSFTNTPIEDL